MNVNMEKFSMVFLFSFLLLSFRVFKYGHCKFFLPFIFYFPFEMEMRSNYDWFFYLSFIVCIFVLSTNLKSSLSFLYFSLPIASFHLLKMCTYTIQIFELIKIIKSELLINIMTNSL